MSFDAEADMLKRWTSLVLETDPDIITGYNINNFDLPYLYDRAKALRVDNDAHYWGRIRHRCVSVVNVACKRHCAHVTTTHCQLPGAFGDLSCAASALVDSNY